MLNIFKIKNKLNYSLKTQAVISAIALVCTVPSFSAGTSTEKDISVHTEHTPIFNETTWKGRWNHIAGALKAQWGKLTDDDLLELEGNQQKLNGIIQKRYGIEQEEARRQVDEFYKKSANDLKLDKKDVNMFLTGNKNIWKGHWHSIKGKLKERWGKFTDNDLLELEGNQEKLEGLVQKKYGINQERAKKEIDEFYEELGRTVHTNPKK